MTSIDDSLSLKLEAEPETPSVAALTRAAQYLRPPHKGYAPEQGRFIADELERAAGYLAHADSDTERWKSAAADSAIERDEAVRYIEGRGIAPTMSKQRIAEFFDERAHRLLDADFADLIVEGLRPVAYLSLSADAVRIAEQVAVSDRYLHPSEAQVINLIRLITMSFPEPKVIPRLP